MTACPHAPAERAEPAASACGECGATEQLRFCESCGHVGCADSRHGHASAHAESSGHPVLAEVVPSGDEGWRYCRTCDAYL